MSKEKKDLNLDENFVGIDCEPSDDMENYEKVENFSMIDERGVAVAKVEGIFHKHLDPKRENTATDVYYKTQCKLPDSKVAVPTYDSVVEAKEWVDDANKM